jgi:hypothetical protein
VGAVVGVGTGLGGSLVGSGLTGGGSVSVGSGAGSGSVGSGVNVGAGASVFVGGGRNVGEGEILVGGGNVVAARGREAAMVGVVVTVGDAVGSGVSLAMAVFINVGIKVWVRSRWRTKGSKGVIVSEASATGTDVPASTPRGSGSIPSTSKAR